MLDFLLKKPSVLGIWKIQNQKLSLWFEVFEKSEFKKNHRIWVFDFWEPPWYPSLGVCVCVLVMVSLIPILVFSLLFHAQFVAATPAKSP